MVAVTPAQAMRTIKLPSGEAVPALGQGTWQLGEEAGKRRGEIAALRLGIESGMTLLDTAELYGEGRTEELVGEAIAGRRDQVFIVSKVLPHNASRQGTLKACAGSLRRLKVDHIDLYLLHWRGPHPLADTIGAFDELVRAGKIRYWGVSNFDLSDMEELARLQSSEPAATNQVLYNLSRRGIEFDLLPYCSRQRMPIMAYSPIEQGRLLRNTVLKKLAVERGVSPAQLALAWLLQHPNVIAIPRARTAEHVRENHRALELKFSAAELASLDRAFPPPGKKQALEML